MGNQRARTYDPNRVDARTRHGTTERWTFVNRSNRVHPMHLHGFLFRVLERSSGPVHPAERLGWKDTIGVLPNETATVLAWFSPYSGRYVFHCHALEHADKAMMLADGGDAVTRRLARVRAAVLAAIAAVIPAARQRGERIVQAVDGAPATASTASRRPDVTDRAGRDGDVDVRRDGGPHNVAASGAQLDRSAAATPACGTRARVLHVRRRRARTASSASSTGPDDGHRDVGTPPPPPPPPLSEQPCAERSAGARRCWTSPTTKRPRAHPRARGGGPQRRPRALPPLRARAGHGALQAGGSSPSRPRTETFGAGTRSLTVRDRRMRGRYRIEIRAADLADNRSREAPASASAEFRKACGRRTPLRRSP